MERTNNAVWCCEKIKDLTKTYREKCNSLRSVGEITCRAKAEIYYNVILDLEKILYGEDYHEE